MAGPVSVYNTLTRGKQSLQKASGEAVTMYVCGPTVYDDPHIGHLRSAYVFDVIRRTIEAAGHPVKFVRNVTDVDDKIIDRANRDGAAIDAITTKYLDAYHTALKRMGIAEPTIEPKATGHIAEMIAMIQALIGKERAYAARGSVYFRVRSLPEYGQLSNQKIDEILQNNRVDAEEGKEDALDFALWKASKEGEPYWLSPWGKGRPGWHIECSAMSGKYLGDEFDIHGGGRDLLFPHHENERAQSIGATGKKFAKFWIHHGLITINGQKMAKSLGNFVSLDDFEKKHHIDVLKLFFLQSHYRSDIDFTWGKMAALQEATERFYTLFAKSSQLPINTTQSSYPEYIELFHKAMHDDFDTPAAIAWMFQLLREANNRLTKDHFEEAAAAVKVIQYCANCLGLFGFGQKVNRPQWYSIVDQLLQLRNESRKAKLYKTSDFIRSKFIEIGFKAEDAKDGNLTLIPVSIVDDIRMELKLSEVLKQAEAMK